MAGNQKGADQRRQQAARNNTNRDPRKPEEDARSRGAQPGRQQSQEAGRPHSDDEHRK
jgi:hypothetical protein